MPELKMLGEPIYFTASVLDYFNNITEPVIFTTDCETCSDDYVLSTYLVTARSVIKRTKNISHGTY